MAKMFSLIIGKGGINHLESSMMSPPPQLKKSEKMELFFRIATHSFYMQIKTLADLKNLFSTYTVYIPPKCLIFKLLLKI